MSEIPWFGPLPKGWRKIRLKWTIKTSRNGTWGSDPDGENDLPCVRVADFDRQTFRVSDNIPTLRAVEQSERSDRELRRGDLLIEKSGGGELQPVGTVVLYDSDRPAVCSNFIARLVAAAGYEAHYLNYLHAALYATKLTFRSIKQTTGIQNLDAYSYFSELVPSPPLDEQRVIAKFLDQETAKLDRLVAAKRQLAALLRERLAVELDSAITRGLRPRMLKASDDRWLTSVPIDWTVVPLGRLTRYLSYGFTNPMPTAAEGPYMVTANDIGDGVVDYASARKTTIEAYTAELTAKSRPKAGDILITKDGTLGRVAVADGRAMCINQSVALLRVDQKRVLVRFVSELLRALTYQARMIFDAGGTTIKHIYISKIIKMPVAVPSLEEQSELVSFAVAKREKYEALLGRIERGIACLEEWRTSLIASAVTGQFDVRNYRPQEAAALCQ
jgi:type I restriction enzyme S subunit